MGEQATHLQVYAGSSQNFTELFHGESPIIRTNMEASAPMLFMIEHFNNYVVPKVHIYIFFKLNACINKPMWSMTIGGN